MVAEKYFSQQREERESKGRRADEEEKRWRVGEDGEEGKNWENENHLCVLLRGTISLIDP